MGSVWSGHTLDKGMIHALDGMEEELFTLLRMWVVASAQGQPDFGII